MLKLTDLRKTTRRSGDGDLRTVYPRFLRDRTLAPRIELAIRYMEKMLGRPRRDLDAEVIVGLFGDHKLARCVVACLAASYRHRARTFAEVLPAETVAGLAMRGLATPSELRLWLFRLANRRRPGFVGAAERAPFLREAGAELGLAPEQIEQLIALDEPAQAVLVRYGPVPTPDDVMARFNYETTAALLASASVVRVSLTRTPRDAATVRALCATVGVRADLAGRELVLHGQQDALESWVRHGARLARLLSALLCCGLPARAAEALVEAPMGAQWRFRLDAEVLGFLGSASGQPVGWGTDDLLAAWRAQEALAAEYAALRRTGGDDDWSLRRAVEPVMVAGAIVPALFVCQRAEQRVPLVLAPSTSEADQRLGELASRLPLVAVRVIPADQPAHAMRGVSGADAGQGLRTLSYAGRGSLTALPELLAAAARHAERGESAARLAALLDEVRNCGVLTEVALAERLGCSEDEVAARLASPVVRAWRDAFGISYIEGFGLCTGAVLTRARAAAADVASLRERSEGATRVARVLGRRLREVTGASAGIECLIAYLGAA